MFSELALIYHITSRHAWHEAKPSGLYRAPSLASQGFIHCSERHQVVEVANRLFRGQTDLVLLCIEEASLGVPVVRENLEGGESLFPHIYGALPAEAVVEVVPFEPTPDGEFELPQDLP